MGLDGGIKLELHGAKVTSDDGDIEGELERVQEFLKSEDLKSAMETAGVAGPPEIFVGENSK